MLKLLDFGEDSPAPLSALYKAVAKLDQPDFLEQSRQEDLRAAFIVLPRQLSLSLRSQEEGFLPLKLRVAVRRYLTYLLQMLQSEEVRGLALRALGESYFLLVSEPRQKMLRRAAGEAVGLWQSSSDLKTVLQTFVFLKGVIVQATSEQKQYLLKKCVFGIAGGQWSWRNHQTRVLAINVFAQLLRLEPKEGYFVVLGYLRSLAEQLQATVECSGKAKEELIRKLYCFGVLGCLRTLGNALAVLEQKELKEMVFPFIQVLQSYYKLAPSPNYIPLALHLVDILLKLSWARAIHVPLTSNILLQVLSHETFKRKKRPGEGGEPVDLDIAYQLSSTRLSYQAVSLRIVDRVAVLLAEFLQTMLVSVGSPDHFHVFIHAVKGLILGFKDVQAKRKLKKVLRLADISASKIGRLKAKNKLSLLNLALCDKFYRREVKTALSEYVKRQKGERQSLIKQSVLATEGQTYVAQEEPAQDDEQDQGYEGDQHQEYEEEPEGEADQQVLQAEEDQQQEEEPDQQQQLEGDPDSEQAANMMAQWEEEEWDQK